MLTVAEEQTLCNEICLRPVPIKTLHDYMLSTGLLTVNCSVMGRPPFFGAMRLSTA